ncbi:fimbrial protein [Providencia alcalifaciens]|uniref:fimbrial protein n=1 Tax=Providencia alcalifaciens TaxID=126385 RepID=UPI001CE18DFE|nr:fimbrial protein [Providencia alcalifaciens]UBX47712.1 fimbrial protein [Providencia alcalifaciens]
MYKKAIIALSLITVSGATLASAPVANLKVTGSITPPTCTIKGQNEVDLEYVFDVSPGMFPVSGNLLLDAKTNSIEVVCDASTYLTFSSTDNRASSVLGTSVYNFGLGLYDTDQKVGFYTITMKNLTVKADSSSAAQAVGASNGTSYLSSLTIDKTKKMAWATAVSTLKAGQIFSADLDVRPTLSSTLKTSSGDAKLDGDATLTFAFSL